MKSLKNITTLIALILIPFFAFATGGNGDKPVNNGAVKTVTIIGTNQMQYSVTKITASAGEKIKVVLKSQGSLPKSAMAHNVVFLKKGTEVEAFVNASAMAKSNDYIAPDFEDQIIAATGLAGGGETVTVTFTVPSEPGTYAYVCSFPGHYYAGMKGVLIVK